MTATDELRKLLDERGVEYEDSELIDHVNRTTTYYTEWGGNDDGDGANVYVEYTDGTVLRMFDATPEQAIAATLGRGTCKWKPADFITEGDWWNTECGESFTWEPYGVPNYCPNCGARVERQE